MSTDWCMEEQCRHRHWRSGSMPTHRRGDDCPPESHAVTGMEHAIEQAAMDARKRAYSDRKAPIQEEDGWAFGQGVTAGVYAALAVLRDRGLLTPAPPTEVRAEAWEQGYSDCWTYHQSNGLSGARENPYRVPVDRAEGDGRAD